MKKTLFVMIIGLLLSGCFVVSRELTPVNSMYEWGRGWFDKNSYESNGEQIYFTAINDRGQRLRYLGGQFFGGMMGMGTNLACASCHGSDGRGGIHTMHMDVMDAPDIRFITLAGETSEHGEGEDSHADEHNRYNLDDFSRAVIGGVHPDGIQLSREMPRWLMDTEDISDLFEYIQTLQ